MLGWWQQQTAVLLVALLVRGVAVVAAVVVLKLLVVGVWYVAARRPPFEQAVVGVVGDSALEPIAVQSMVVDMGFVGLLVVAALMLMLQLLRVAQLLMLLDFFSCGPTLLPQLLLLLLPPWPPVALRKHASEGVREPEWRRILCAPR